MTAEIISEKYILDLNDQYDTNVFRNKAENVYWDYVACVTDQDGNQIDSLSLLAELF